MLPATRGWFVMTQTKTLAEMTPEERQRMVDDFRAVWKLLGKAAQDFARAIVAAWTSIPPEVREALIAEAAAPDEEPELPEPDQIIQR
jgi:hypothetical protein